jgi:hypothetical protein
MRDYPNVPSKMEVKILQARLDGLSFCQIEGNDLRVATDQIMFKGAAISGCPLPNTEGFAEVIADELISFINEHGYAELTLSEILLAMRLNAEGGNRHPGTGNYMETVAFTGNCFNIMYVSKILSNYILFRNHLDRKFENKINGY